MKISVCMASYNGAAYIRIQLDSILSQLSPTDEVIIVDDCSTDDTFAILQSYTDLRLKILRNNQNQGVIKTFERSITIAQGDIIFLSDQDDCWPPNKVGCFLDCFKQNPDVTLVISDAALIDQQGAVIAPSYFGVQGAFQTGLLANIIKSKFIGCAMAFRRNSVEGILPFPPNIPMHDMWIGCMHARYGKIFFIDQPLLQHRRHQHNASPDKRRGFVQILKWRWQLIRSLLSR